MDVFTFLKLYKWYQIAQHITYVNKVSLDQFFLLVSGIEVANSK